MLARSRLPAIAEIAAVVGLCVILITILASGCLIAFTAFFSWVSPLTFRSDVLRDARDASVASFALLILLAYRSVRLAAAADPAWRRTSLPRLAPGAWRRWLPAIAVAVPLGPVAILLPRFGAAPFERLVLRSVDTIVHWIYPNATNDLAHRVVGTTAFHVRVDPSCMGTEGMTLALALVVPYLWMTRHQLRFPRAFLLIPVLCLATAIVNVGRIVLLVVIGQHQSRAAVAAFHSSIGWFLFACTVAIVIPVAEHALRLGRKGTERRQTGATHDSATPFLVPLIASLVATAAISMLAMGNTPFALLRYGVSVATLLVLHRALPTLAVRHVLVPLAAGAAVATFWIPSTAGSGPPSSGLAVTLGGSSLLLAAVHIAGFTIVTPLVEELAFRGFLLRRMVSSSFAGVAYREVTWGALLVSSIVFGAIHSMWSQAAVAGLIFGIVARREEGVGPAFLAHATANALICLYALSTGRLEVIG